MSDLDDAMKNRNYLSVGTSIAIRKILAEDAERLAAFPYSVSINDFHGDLASARRLFDLTGFWQKEAGAVAMVDFGTDQILGTLQFYRSGPCIHGIELGYVVHGTENRGKGVASQGLKLFSDYLFAELPWVHRQQLMIEVWHTPSWKVAERSGFVREGILRCSGLGEGEPGDSFVYSRTRKDYGEELRSSNGATK